MAFAPQKADSKQVDLATTSFLFQRWLDEYPLNPHTVLDYFKHSPFYDRTCNNEIIAQQKLPPSHLRSLRGVEYVLAPFKNSFVIRKQYRDSPTKVSVLQVFYVVGEGEQGVRGCVYTMPDVHTLCRHNLMTGMHYLQEAVSGIQDFISSEQGEKEGWRSSQSSLHLLRGNNTK